jgi:phage-related minor tail protein
MANVFMQEFQRMVSQKAAAGLMGLIGNLFGGGFGGLFGGGGGFGDAPQASLSGIGQMAFGGGAGSSGFSAANVAGFGQPLGLPLFNAFAEGGIVTKPMMGLVGEAGREAIIPLDKLDGMGNNVSIVVNVSNDGSVTTDQQNASQLGRELESAVVAVLQKQKRPGGLLASVR